jgi:hypothetical protein
MKNREKFPPIAEEEITIYDNLMDVLLLAAYLVLLFGSFVAVVMFWSC